MPLKSDLYALCVHGIGQDTPANFADQAMKQLAAGLQPLGVTLYAKSVHWSPLVDGPQKALKRTLKRMGSSGRVAQSLAVRTLSDALSYPQYQEQINYLIDYEVSRLRAPSETLIFAHSLGVVLATDYLKSRTGVKARMVSFGTNLNLFHVGDMANWQCPAQLQGRDSWLNMYSKYDALGYPLRGWLPHVRDAEVTVGGVFTWWNGASHMAFWDDKYLWRETVPTLLDNYF